MRHVSVLIALVLLLSCQGGATGQQAAMMAAPPPPNVNWDTYTVTKGAQYKVRQYLDSIDELAETLQAGNKALVKAATAELRQKIFKDHKAEDGWARVMLAHRFGARGEWAGCVAELSAATRTDNHPGGWLDFNGTPHGKTVKELLDDIEQKNNARKNPNPNPSINDVNISIGDRRQGPNQGHELNEGWNRILIAFYIAQGAGDNDAEWKRVKDELDHLDPPN